MADLSRAAQAVADATEILVHKGFSGRDVAAAALRAAALYCKRDSAILLSFADELEGAQ